MKKSVSYKIANHDEIKNLCSLFSDVYKKKFTQDELAWRYLNNPSQEGKIFNCVALNNNNEIVGHTAFIKHIFKFNGKSTSGGLTVGSAVKKEYSGIFAPMYLFLENKYSSEFDFFYGYPNNNSYPFFTKLFNYKLINSHRFQFKCKWESKSQINKIINIIKSQIPIRDSEFLLWRLTENPINKYFYFYYDDVIILWKKYTHIEYDIIGILPNSLKLNLEQKKLREDCIVNIFYAINYDSPLNNGFKKLKLFNSNNFIIKNNSNQTLNDMLCFQMLDIDIY